MPPYHHDSHMTQDALHEEEDRPRCSSSRDREHSPCTSASRSRPPQAGSAEPQNWDCLWLSIWYSEAWKLNVFVLKLILTERFWWSGQTWGGGPRVGVGLEKVWVGLANCPSTCSSTCPCSCWWPCPCPCPCQGPGAQPLTFPCPFGGQPLLEQPCRCWCTWNRFSQSHKI